MSDAETPGLDAAYALDGPEDNRRLYAAWAATYDADFARAMDYRLPALVAAAFAERGGQGPVLDLGAGTGLVGEALAAMGVGPVDATDLSDEMLSVARGKGVYRDLFPGDMTARLPVADGAYRGAVCAGTFTHGHVGPAALAEVLRCVAPGGLALVSVNAAHFAAKDFASTLKHLADTAQIETITVPIYGEAVTGAHGKDQAVLVALRPL